MKVIFFHKMLKARGKNGDIKEVPSGLRAKLSAKE